MVKDIKIDTEKFDGKRVAVALSGGRDSVALAYALKEAGVSFFAINVEHGIRGEASLADSRFVAEFCLEQGIELKSFSVDVLKRARDAGESIEHAARTLRYEVFEGVLSRGECDYIATAHHRDDQVETIVMRALRGTGLKGLIGMAPQNGKYLRPFLEYSREDIDAYIAHHNLAYAEDETNADTAYTRNFLRHQFAMIRLRYPSFDDAILRLSRNADEAESFIDKFVPTPKMVEGEVQIAIDDLKEGAIAKRLIMKAANLLDVYQDIEERHFPLILGLINMENGKRIALTHGICAHKDGENIVFCKRGLQVFTEDEMGKAQKGQEGSTEIEIIKIERSEVEEIIIEKIKDKSIERGLGILFADGDKIPDSAIWRVRRDGDMFTKFGGGTKSLGDYLTDKKYPKRMRDSIMVLADGQDILAIADVEISDKIKFDQTTKNIVKISVKRGGGHVRQ